jgi:hypothetical protein
MERFSAMFLVLVLLMGLLVGTGFRDKRRANKIVLGAAAKYTSQTQFSLSGDLFEVIDVYRNSDYTKAFILLKTSSMNNLPLDATKYQMFMTSGDRSKPLTCNPVGGIYIFGNTGYMGLSFIDKNGFDSNLYDIIVRNYDMIVQPDTEGAQRAWGNVDISFVHHNQLKITANLAGSRAKVVPFLDADSFTLSDVYMQLVGDSGMSNLRARTNATLLSMSKAMAEINNAADKLRDRNVVVPNLPHQIANDVITMDSDATVNNPHEFDPSMVSYADTSSSYRLDSNVPLLSDEDLDALYAGETVVDSTSDSGAFTTSDSLYLQTNYVFPSGLQFNYQDVDLSMSMLNSLKDSETSYATWKAVKADERNQYGYEMGLPSYTWTYTTGNTVPSLNSYSSPADKDIWSLISVYTDNVAYLFNLKQSYQTELLYGYLDISNSGRDVESIFSVNADSETLLLY